MITQKTEGLVGNKKHGVGNALSESVLSILKVPGSAAEWLSRWA